MDGDHIFWYMDEWINQGKSCVYLGLFKDVICKNVALKALKIRIYIYTVYNTVQTQVSRVKGVFQLAAGSYLWDRVRKED